MSSNDRRAAARRRAWGRGPIILRFEPLEGRHLLSGATATSSSISPSFDANSQAIAAALAQVTPGTTIQAPVPSVNTSAASLATTSAASTTATAMTNPNPGYNNANTGTVAGQALLALTAFDTAHALDWGDAFTATGTVLNAGAAATTSAYEVDVLASATAVPGANAVVVGSVPVPTGIASGQSFSYSQAMTAPIAPIAGLGTSSSYFLVAELEPAGTATGSTTSTSSTAATATSSSSAGFALGTNSSTTVASTSTTPDPTISSSAAATSAVTETPHLPSNLVGTSLTIAPSAAAWGGSISVNASVHNVGQGDAPATTARVVLTPSGQAPGGSADFEIGEVAVPAVAASQQVAVSQAITLPATPPLAFAGSTQFTVSMVQDSAGTANPVVNSGVTATPATAPLAIAATIQAPAAQPDLSVAAVNEPSPEIDRGGTFTVGATIQNAGAGDAGPFQVRFLLSSTADPTAPAIVLGEASVPGLKAGMAQGVAQTVTFPYNITNDPLIGSATVQVIAEIDPGHAVDDSNLANNYLAGTPVTLSAVAADGTSAMTQSVVTYNDGTTATGAALSTASTTAAAASTTAATTTAAPTTTTTTTATATTATPRMKLTKAEIKVQLQQAKVRAQQAKAEAQALLAAAKQAKAAARVAAAATIHALHVRKASTKV